MKKVTLLSLVFCVVSVAQATADTVQGFVYTGGTFTSIVPGVDTQASGINDAGQIVGSFTDSRGDPTGGFLYTAGSITTIPLPLPPGALLRFPLGINDAGQIVGTFEESSSVFPFFVAHGFLYDAGTFTTFDVPGGRSTAATGINDAGQIVGVFGLQAGGGGSRGFVRGPDGSFTVFDGPGAFAYGINDAGQMVGSSFDGTTSHGFLYTAGSFTFLDPPGSVFTVAWGINDAGQTVGYFSDGSINNPFHGFLYDAGAYTIIDVPGRGQTFAYGINDAGQIVGSSFPEGPVPEPGSMLLFGSGLAGIWAFASRKRRSA
jgi:probable HAF family extracellular repeat protein